MPQLRWSEGDFLDCFCMEPAVGEFEVSHRYEMARDGLRAQITVWQLESVIQLSLSRSRGDAVLLSFAAYVRGEVRFINDRRGRYIEAEDCVIAPDRFLYMQAGNVFDRERFPSTVTMRIAVDPDIQFTFVNYESRT